MLLVNIVVAQVIVVLMHPSVKIVTGVWVPASGVTMVAVNLVIIHMKVYMKTYVLQDLQQGVCRQTMEFICIPFTVVDNAVTTRVSTWRFLAGARRTCTSVSANKNVEMESTLFLWKLIRNKDISESSTNLNT